MSLSFLNSIIERGNLYKDRPVVRAGDAGINSSSSSPSSLLSGCAHKVVAGSVASTSSTTRGSIYLGPKESCITSDTRGVYEELLEHGIGAIVNCTVNLPCVFESREGIQYHRVAVHDDPTQDLLVHMLSTAKFMEKYLSSGISVLVHCEMGRSRSASIVIAHQIAFACCTRDVAYLNLKSIRQITEPNQGFWQQLHRFQEQCNHSPSSALQLEAEAGMGMFDDDVFWGIALDSKSHSDTDFLAPGRRQQQEKEEQKQDRGRAKAFNGHWLVPISLPSSSSFSSSSSKGGVILTLNEMRGEGVMDVIGGELWEAALLLSAHMMIHEEYFAKRALLELGAGVGMCGLLALQLKLRYQHPLSAPSASLNRTCQRCHGLFNLGTNTNLSCLYHPESFGGETAQRWMAPGDTAGAGTVHTFWSCCGSHNINSTGCCSALHASFDGETTHTGDMAAADLWGKRPGMSFIDTGTDGNANADDFTNTGIGEVCMTDYEARVLTNLCDTVTSTLLVNSTSGSSSGERCAEVAVAVEHLDWFDVSCYPDPQRFDIALGSALCYSIDHAEALHRSIRHLLQPGARCQNVLIVQISDRPGFQRLLHYLQSDQDLQVTIESMSDDVYMLAQAISSSSSQPLSHFYDLSQSQSQHAYGNEDEVTCKKSYCIPEVMASAAYADQPLHTGHRRNLLKTGADAFAMVTIARSR